MPTTIRACYHGLHGFESRCGAMYTWYCRDRVRCDRFHYFPRYQHVPLNRSWGLVPPTWIPVARGQKSFVGSRQILWFGHVYIWLLVQVEDSEWSKPFSMETVGVNQVCSTMHTAECVWHPPASSKRRRQRVALSNRACESLDDHTRKFCVVWTSATMIPKI